MKHGAVWQPLAGMWAGWRPAREASTPKAPAPTDTVPGTIACNADTVPGTVPSWIKPSAIWPLLVCFLSCSGEPRTEPSLGSDTVPGTVSSSTVSSTTGEQIKSAAFVRAGRRLFDGAPPVIPHVPFGASCLSCHGLEAIQVPEVGLSPPSPHSPTDGMSAISRCQQCHVFQQTAEPWRSNAFAGLRQDLRQGRQLNAWTPPVIPHRVWMRENCLACHTGPAAREEIRTSHPERNRCLQCHLEQQTQATFGS